MSSLEDDSLCCGSIITDRPVHVTITPPLKSKSTLRDRIIDYVINHPKTIKGDIYTNISSSGTCQTLITSLVTSKVLLEHKFDCGSCVYYSINTEKVHEI